MFFGAQKNNLYKMDLLSTRNLIIFAGEIRKIISIIILSGGLMLNYLTLLILSWDCEFEP